MFSIWIFVTIHSTYFGILFWELSILSSFLCSTSSGLCCIDFQEGTWYSLKLTFLLFGILAFGVLPCLLDNDKAGILGLCLLKKSTEGSIKEIATWRWSQWRQVGRFVVLSKFRDTQGCGYCLFYNYESSFSIFLGLAIPEWFLPWGVQGFSIL